MMDEGGFNGRINKLVDSCYNFWQGASFEMIDIAMKGKGNIDGEYLYN
jgi:protein farnesyltransferase subunit beta